MPQSDLDSGRPVVVVTGMGVLTSLGEGKAENWRELTAGVFRHPPHQPLPHRRPAHHHRRHGGFRPGRGHVRAATVADASPSSWPTKPSPKPASDAGDFPGPLFLAMPPVEMEWPQRLALAAASGANETVTYADLLRAAGNGAVPALVRALPVRLGGGASGRPLRHQRLADRHLHRLRVRRHGDPAWRGGDPPRRGRGGAGRSAPTPRSTRKA